MKGFVPTPAAVVDLMVAKLFNGAPPSASSVVLDPGCGEGEFIAGVLRWCESGGTPVPRLIGVELDPSRAARASSRFAGVAQVEIRTADFLTGSHERADYIIGNPPYVPITALDIDERETYRRIFASARGRFDLYLLFLERALGLLKSDGRLVFITPEKFLYVDTAKPLRQILTRHWVEELHFLDERTFGELVTYPIVSTIVGHHTPAPTAVVHRAGESATVQLRTSGSWLPLLFGRESDEGGFTLSDVCVRISCGVATGADSIYVIPDSHVTPELAPFARPTISGRQLVTGGAVTTRSSMLIPYDAHGQLIPERELRALRTYLTEPRRREKLERRTCASRKPWYAFHETPPLPEINRPKLLCKDIGAVPFFAADSSGEIVPRHSVYYLVPKDPEILNALASHLNSAATRDWLRAHCQRAANGFIRLQSQVLKRVPVPAALVPRARGAVELSLGLEARLA